MGNEGWKPEAANDLDPSLEVFNEKFTRAVDTFIEQNEDVFVGNEFRKARLLRYVSYAVAGDASEVPAGDRLYEAVEALHQIFELRADSQEILAQPFSRMRNELELLQTASVSGNARYEGSLTSIVDDDPDDERQVRAQAFEQGKREFRDQMRVYISGGFPEEILIPIAAQVLKEEPCSNPDTKSLESRLYYALRDLLLNLQAVPQEPKYTNLDLDRVRAIQKELETSEGFRFPPPVDSADE